MKSFEIYYSIIAAGIACRMSETVFYKSEKAVLSYASKKYLQFELNGIKYRNYNGIVEVI